MTLTHLILVRHGHTENENPEAPWDDAQRRLTERGHADMLRVGSFLRRADLIPEKIWTTSLVRAQQTTALVCEGMGLDEVSVEVFEGLEPQGRVRPVMEMLSRADVKTLMIVGHNPLIAELLSSLASAGVIRHRFKRGAIALVRVGEIRGRVIGELRALIPPSMVMD